MEMSTRLGLHTMETEKGRASLVFSHGRREFEGERAGAGVNSLQKFHLNSTSQRLSPSIQTSTSTPFNSFFPDSTSLGGLHTGSRRPRSLVALCLGVLGKHLEDIIVDLCEVSSIFPPDIKMAILSISRRRKLLDDYSLIALADTSWELLDISGSAVSNVGLERVPGICPNLKALDISQCDKITADAVSHLLFQCHRLEILRCGGSHRSDFTAWRCLKFLKPSLEVVEEESWEELDSSVLAKGGQSLRWLIWAPDRDSIKLNFDGCSLGNPGPAGISGLFRNHEGTILASFSKPIGDFDFHSDEARALLKGLKLFDRNWSSTFVIEGDSKNVICWAFGTAAYPWFLALNFEEISCQCLGLIVSGDMFGVNTTLRQTPSLNKELHI